MQHKSTFFLLCCCLFQTAILHAQLSTLKMPYKAVYPMSIVLDNKLILAGGYNTSELTASEVTDKVQIYDLGLQTWSEAKLSKPFRGEQPVQVGSKAYFVVDTDTVDVYDALSNTWSVLKLPIPQITRPVVIGKKIYFVSTWVYLFPSSPLENNNEQPLQVYDTETGLWTTLYAPFLCSDPTVVASGKKLYLVNGYLYSNANGDQFLKKMQALDTETGTWTVSNFNYKHNYMPGFAINGSLYLVGGISTDDFVPTGLISIYNEATGTWTTKNNSLVRADPGVAALGNLIYLAGGYYNFTYQKTITTFNTVTNGLVISSPLELSQGREDIATASDANRIFFIGGVYRTGPGPNILSDVIDVYTAPVSAAAEPDLLPLKAYPALCTEVLTVSLPEGVLAEDCRMELWGLDGRQYALQQLAGNTGEQQISTAHLPAGNYLLRVFAGKQVYGARFVKM